MFQPLGNSTVLPVAGWHPEPQTRGTFSVLSSCLITMSLCIWTSLHLNLPEHKKEHLHKYHKLGWMILGLIAPEMVVWNAWEQRKEMKKVSKLMQEKGSMPVNLTVGQRVRRGLTEASDWALTSLLLRAKDWPELKEPLPYKQYNGRINPWTDVHSWLVVMGGMSFEDSAEEDQQFMPENRQRINISVQGFKHVLRVRDRLIPDVSREHIQDKSKSDRLAKILTCWQAGYFCIQCVYRLSQQLSVTLLELNVFAHAVCALALFIIWSDKPRDVCEPTSIVGEDAMDICALFCLYVVGSDHSERSPGYQIESQPRQLDDMLEIEHPTSFTVEGSRDNGFARSLKVLGSHWTLSLRGSKPRNTKVVTIDARDLNRLQRVSRLVQREKIGSSGPVCIDLINMLRMRPRHSLARTKNWSLDINHIANNVLRFVTGDHHPPYDPWAFVWFVAGLTFAGTCYGGLHLVAWKTPFASRAEALLWRAASVSIMAAGPFFVFVVAYHKIPRIIYRRYRRDRSSPTTRKISGNARFFIEFSAAWFIAGPSILWYIFCRVFIIVESFIMLAHIPNQALQVPTWSAYLPHIA